MDLQSSTLSKSECLNLVDNSTDEQLKILSKELGKEIVDFSKANGVESLHIDEVAELVEHAFYRGATMGMNIGKEQENAD